MNEHCIPGSSIPTMRWEMQPARIGMADLDEHELTRAADEAVRGGRKPVTRSTDDVLRCFGLLRDGRPVNAAAVLFGRADRLAVAYPQCTLRLARFRGRDTSALVEGLEARENVFQALRRAERFLPRPSAAVREALANAACRRDYGPDGGCMGVAIFTDRVEVSYSGAPSDELRPGNPTIASVLRLRGWMNGRGASSGRAGLASPEASESPGQVVMRFRRMRADERRSA